MRTPKFHVNATKEDYARWKPKFATRTTDTRKMDFKIFGEIKLSPTSSSLRHLNGKKRRLLVLLWQLKALLGVCWWCGHFKHRDANKYTSDLKQQNRKRMWYNLQCDWCDATHDELMRKMVKIYGKALLLCPRNERISTQGFNRTACRSSC